MTKVLLKVENVSKSFSQGMGKLNTLLGKQEVSRVLDHVNFSVHEGKTLGIVGESGCGKTTLGKAILGLLSIDHGRIFYENHEINRMTRRQLRPLRRHMQMIFQDLDAALNPKLRIKYLLKEAIKVHQSGLTKKQVEYRMLELLELVNLNKDKLNQFPFELSGGEKRRVGIARVLAVEPKLIIADEPTSALDVSIQAQVINLLKDLQDNLGLTYVFISHDLPLVELISHDVAVMYQGQIVELGTAEQISRTPKHPYTAMLWSSLGGGNQQRSADFIEMNLQETMSSDVTNELLACPFAYRCPVYQQQGQPAICLASEKKISLTEQNNEHKVACHFPLHEK